MTCEELRSKLNLEIINESNKDLEVVKGYTGDLLSWVMGNADSGCAWITIMTNHNILAVAALKEISCIIIAENSDIPPNLQEQAAAREINIYRSHLNSFDLSYEVKKLLK